MYKKKPFFIIFEGVEGCGKSYQSQKLKKNLEKKGINLLLTREPGGTRSAESIRRLILKDYFNKGKKEKFDKYTDTLLYLAARNEHIKYKIKPALKKKKVTIIGLIGKAGSTLSNEANIFLDTSVKKEACTLDLAPTASTTATLAMGDALAISLLELRGFNKENFAELHPGGILGKKLLLTISL